MGSSLSLLYIHRHSAGSCRCSLGVLTQLCSDCAYPDKEKKLHDTECLVIKNSIKSLMSFSRKIEDPYKTLTL